MYILSPDQKYIKVHFAHLWSHILQLALIRIAKLAHSFIVYVCVVGVGGLYKTTYPDKDNIAVYAAACIFQWCSASLLRDSCRWDFEIVEAYNLI